MEVCPDCGKEVSRRAASCPHCGAPRMKTEAYRRMVKPDWGFEWRLGPEILGIPLAHVAIGRKDGKLRVAKGIIAVGQFAIGYYGLGQIAFSYFSWTPESADPEAREFFLQLNQWSGLIKR